MNYVAHSSEIEDRNVPIFSIRSERYGAFVERRSGVDWSNPLEKV